MSVRVLNVNGSPFEMNVEVVEGVLSLDTLFIHGNVASNTWWEPTLSELKKRKPEGRKLEGRFIAAEWRGCGRSGPPRAESELSPKVLAQDYLALLDAMGIKKAVAVGHSTGGAIALCAALQDPSRFEKIVLLDSVGATGVQFAPETFEAFTQMSQNREFCAAVMGGTIHGNDPASPLFQRIVDDAFGIAKLNWHGVPRQLQNFNISKEIGSIRVPVLVLHGELDPVIPVETAKTLAAALPNSRLEIFPNQGHSPNVENPSLFVDYLL